MEELSRVKEGQSNLESIDKIDRKILRALFSKERVSFNYIGDKVRASKEVVNYRINKLKEHGILQGKVTIIDNSKLGFNVNIVYLKLQNINREREKSIISFFVEHMFVKVIATCTGLWDMFVVFCSKDITHFNKLLIEFENFLGINLKKKRAATIINEFFLPYNYIHKFSDADKISKRKKIDTIKLDPKDIEILNLISKNADLSLVEIAQSINLTPEAISYRIKRLITNEVITGFFPLINISKLGYQWYTVSLFLKNISEKRENDLQKYLIGNENIVVVINTVGEWNIEFDVHIESALKLRELLMDIREIFSDIINDFESNLIFNDYKYTHLPKGIIKIFNN